MATTAPHGGEGSDACAHGGDMQPHTTASTRWRLVKSTTAYGHRRRTGPGRLRTKLFGDRSSKQPRKRCSSSCLTKTPRGCGPGFSLSPGRKNGSSGTPWSTSSTSSAARLWCRFSTLLCHRWWNSCQTTVPEQVVEVPKILPEDAPMRTVVRAAGGTAGGSADDIIHFLVAAD